MIEREYVDDVAVVRLAHGKVNALDLELLNAITETFTELDERAPRDRPHRIRSGLLRRGRPVADHRRRLRLHTCVPAGTQ
jgi:hypothetical protein